MTLQELILTIAYIAVSSFVDEWARDLYRSLRRRRGVDNGRHDAHEDGADDPQ